jgi:hypothetical protein
MNGAAADDDDDDGGMCSGILCTPLTGSGIIPAAAAAAFRPA